MTFTTGNWSTAQTVSVTAEDDSNNARDGEATVTHTASSTDGDYNGVTIVSVTVMEVDDDEAVTVTIEDAPESAGGPFFVRVVFSRRTDGFGDAGDVAVVNGRAEIFEGDPTSDGTSFFRVLITPDGVGDIRIRIPYEAAGDIVGIPNEASEEVTVRFVPATAGVTVSDAMLSVPEAGSATYMVVLATLPTGPVTVSVAKQAGGDNDLTVAPTALTFTTADWNTPQTVTVSAAADADAAAGTATITHTATSTDSDYNGITIAPLTATEDDDTVGVTVDPETLSVTEESTATYTVVLNTQPTGPVTVGVAKQAGGDDDLSVDPTTLTFTTGNWSTPKTVTVSAADDVDGANGAATFTHSASGAGYGSVVIASVKATEDDNDTPGVTVGPGDAVGDRGVDGHLHGGFGHPAHRLGHRERGEAGRGRSVPDGERDRPDLHDGELEHGADGDGERGGRW